MLNLGLDELFTPELLRAFRERWAATPDVSAEEAREIVRQLTNPTEREVLVVKVVHALVGEKPDFHAWMEALTVGSFELRPNVKYAQPGKAKIQPARFYREQQKLIDSVANKNLTAAEAAEWRHAYDDALRLIVASQLLKEMRVGVAAKAAIGLAWPLMVAVNSHFNAEEKKALHAAGADPDLIRTLSVAARLALRRFMKKRGTEEAQRGSGRAGWERNAPPGADAEEYFAKDAERVDEHTTPPPTLEDVEQAILRGPRPSFLPAVMKRGGHERMRKPAYFNLVAPPEDVPSSKKVTCSEEVSTWDRASELAFSKALRAVARKRHRETLVTARSPLVYSDDFRLQVWLQQWAAEGREIPTHLPIRLFSYLEEEVCLAFETWGHAWPGTYIWRQYGVIGKEFSRVRPASLDWDCYDTAEFTWVKPRPRRIDIIDVRRSPSEE